MQDAPFAHGPDRPSQAFFALIIAAFLVMLFALGLSANRGGGISNMRSGGGNWNRTLQQRGWDRDYRRYGHDDDDDDWDDDD